MSTIEADAGFHTRTSYHGTRAFTPQGQHLRTVHIKALLDVLPHPTAVFDTAARQLYANQHLKNLLQHDPHSDAVLHALRELGRIAALEKTEGRIDVNTNGCRYHVRAAFLDLQLIGTGATVVLSVEPKQEVLPDPVLLQTTFSLTAQESRVALLLAQRARTEEIAERLRISKNTVRRHIERVLAKLHISTRADVCERLSVLAHRSN